MAHEKMKMERRYLACHFAKFLGREFAADDALTQTRIRLVLEVDKQGTNFSFIIWGGATKLSKDGLFDGDRTVDDEIAG